MPEIITVTSPFIDQNNQLFYQASYNKQTQTLSLKIFNHRGVLKNKRTMSLTQPIADLFTTEEYLIGLNQDHHKIFIFDVRHHLKSMIWGEVDESARMKEKMRKNNQKFTYFFYNRDQPLIYGVFDEKHIFYFRLNNFSKGEEGPLINSRRSNKSQNEQSQNKCEIGRIHTFSEPISKLEVQYKMKRILPSKSPKKSSLVFDISEDNQSYQPQSSPRKEHSDDIREEKVTYIYVLAKQRRQMRELEVIWSGDRPEVHEKVTEGVENFCFKNGWNLVIKGKLQQKSMNGRKKGAEMFEISQKGAKGDYQTDTKLSSQYKIFTCNQTIFIIDSEEQTILGVYNKEFFEIQKCEKIPQSISLERTLLMLERPDQSHLKFVFYIFERSFSQFKSYSLIVKLYYEKDTRSHDETYLKNNIEKVFTANGLIHPYFKERVGRLLYQIECKSQSSTPMSEKSFDEKEMMMRRKQEVEKRVSMIDENPYDEAFFLLEKFVMKNDKLLYRVMHQLCSYGANVLFGDKPYDISLLKRSEIRPHSKIKSSTEQILHDQSRIQEVSEEIKQFESSLKSKYRCNFDTWNEYFHKLIYLHTKQLQDLCEAHKDAKSFIVQSMIDEDITEIDRIFERINKTKEQLILLSNVYKRFLSLIETSQSYQGDENNRILKFYQEVVRKNMNKIHSLILIYCLFKEGDYKPAKNEPKKAEKRLNKAVEELLKRFKAKRDENIKKSQVLDQIITNRSEDSQKLNVNLPHLMLHEMFNSALQQVGLESSKKKLSDFLTYLLSNLEEFQETGYFCYLLREELNCIILKEERSGDQSMLMGSRVRQNESSISSGSKHLYVSQNLTEMYMGETLREFYEIMSDIEGFSYRKMSESQITDKVTLLQKLSLQISSSPFKLYTIQLCSYHNLPAQIIELVDSIKIKPFIVNEEAQSYSQLEKQLQFKLRVSKVFGEQETFIIRQLAKCCVGGRMEGERPQNYVSSQQILVFLIKRILQVDDVVISKLNYHMECLNYHGDSFHKVSKHYLLPQENYENHQIYSNSQQKNQNQPKIYPQIKLKNYLLTYFIEAVLVCSNKQLIRQLQELKRDCFTRIQDKEEFQNVLSHYKKNY